MLMMEGVNSIMTKAKLKAKLENDFINGFLRIGINRMSRTREEGH